MALSQALLLAGSAAAAAAQGTQPSPFSSDPQLDRLVNSANGACRNALVRRYDAMAANLDLWLTPGLRIGIESGETSLAELRRSGLQFGWMVRGRPAPVPIGLCRTSGEGRVLAIEEQQD